jgi:hypothetical protein
MSVGERPVGLSSWEERLYDHLLEHVETERAVLDEYDELASRSSGHVRYLLEMIGTDEARHHHLYEQWAATIREMAQLRDATDGIPPLHAEDDPHAVVRAAEHLLAVEREDETELRRLRKDLTDFEDTTLWPLLVDLMRLDTQKHIKILEFLRRHARQTIKAQK